MSTEILRGDCRKVLPTLPPRRFRCCVTSPPYWMQRRYMPKDHHDADLEIGGEFTVAEYVDTLVNVFDGIRSVLTDDGGLWINIGDKYTQAPGGTSIGGGGGFSARVVQRLQDSASRGRMQRGQTDLPPKCLIGIPWRFAIAMMDAGWILRSEIIWEKANAMPSSVHDRPTTSHEHVFFFVKSPSHFFGQDAVREPNETADRAGRRVSASSFKQQAAVRPRGKASTTHVYNDLGRNARTVWRIAVGHDELVGSHAAPMPVALARRCVLAGSGAGDWVLDPFGGRGTVGAVAASEGRHAVLIDLDSRACDAARLNTAQEGLPFAG